MGVGRAHFFERCPAPALVLGPDGAVADANPAWCAATGWEWGDLLGRPLRDLVHPDDAPAGDALAGAWEARCVRPDGVLVRMAWDVADAGGAYLCVARPLTAEEARRRERFEADFINLAAHELNTPLTPIQLALDTLGMSASPGLDRDARQSIDLVQRNFGRLRAVVAELLDAARIRAGRLALDLRDADLSALARQAVEDARLAAAEAGVTLRAHVEDGLAARVDPARMRQALVECLACGIECGPAGTLVAVSVRRDAGEAVAAVACPGASLTPEQRESLFAPFPPHAPRKGLGLYLARGIIGLHGGATRAEPHDASGGLRLSLRIPLAGPAGPAPHAGAGRTATVAR